MNVPMLTWSLIAGLFILIVIVRITNAAIFCRHGNHHYISFGSEREEVFIPGDTLERDTNDYEDIDDL